MEYAQVNELGTEATQVATNGNVAWDENNFCSAQALTNDGKADQFRVVPLTVTEPPVYDRATQFCYRDGCEFVGGQWQYKWTVRVATQDEMDAYAAELAAQAQATADATAKAEAKADAVITYLVNHTPAQIAAKVDADVTSLATAKTYIAKLAVAVSVLARKELR